MKGPYRLIFLKIDEYVPSKPGVYCLTYSSGSQNIACYVGRSDNDLRSRLKNYVYQNHKDHLPQNKIDDCIKKSGVDKFYFQETYSEKGAYDLECRWYHEYNPTCNKYHPDKTYQSWLCPVCGK